MGLATRLGALAMTVALAGCATTNPQDPLEGFNRAMFGFNDAVDQVALKPAAKIYKDVLPSFVQSGIGNFFGNIGDIWTAVNNLLQGKLADGVSDVMRVAVNSTMGLGGVLDIGSEAGLTKHNEDFGQTLGKWGVKSGPYVVLPFFGASTLRDTAVLPLDFKADLWGYKYPVLWRNIGTAVRLVDQRAAVLDASDLVEEAAFDKYEFVRDAYMQRRESTINDGESPKAPPADSSSVNMAPLSLDSIDLVVVSALSTEPGTKSIVETEQNNKSYNPSLPLQEGALEHTVQPSATPVSSNSAAKQLTVSTE